MESIEQKLLNCYNDVGCDIILEPGQYKDVTIEDIIAIIQLTHNRYVTGNLDYLVETDDFEIINERGYYKSISVGEDIELPHILTTLYMMEPGGCDMKHTKIFGFDRSPLYYPIQDKERFLELAIKTGIVNYDITRNIMKVFNMKYLPNTELGVKYLRSHLGIDTKSSRNI